MALRPKDERIAIYFDLLCGIISSAIALIGIFYVFFTHRIISTGWFTVSLIFWIGYLVFSFTIIGFGIYVWKREKHFDSSKQRTDLRAPIA
jgi:uncharacterized membrane protein (DUF485 family)